MQASQLPRLLMQFYSGLVRPNCGYDDSRHSHTVGKELMPLWKALEFIPGAVEADMVESYHFLSPTSWQGPCQGQALGWQAHRTQGSMF